MIHTRHYMAALIAGFFLGLIVIYNLFAIAIPLHTEYLLTLEQYRYLNKLQDLVINTDISEDMLYLIILLFSLPFLFSIISIINPQLKIHFSWQQLPEFYDVSVTRKFRAWISIMSGCFLLMLMFILTIEYAAKDNLQAWFMIITTTAFVWLFLSPGAWGNFSDKKSQHNFKSYLLTFLSGAAFMLTFILLIVASFTLLTEFIEPVLTEVYDTQYDISSFSINALCISILTLTCGVTLLITGVLPLFTKTDLLIKQRIVSSKKELSRLIATIMIIAIMLPIVAVRYDLNKEDIAATGIFNNIKTGKYKLIRFCKNTLCDKTRSQDALINSNNSIYAQAWNNKTEVYTLTRTSSLPVSETALTPLRKFINDAHNLSVLRKLVIEGIFSVQEKLLQPESLFTEMQQYEEKGILPPAHSVLWTLKELRWLASAAPITEHNRARLEWYSDSRKFFHGTLASAYLAVAWSRFADAANTNRFIQNADADSLAKLGLSNNNKPAISEIMDGKITGKITRNTLPLDNVNVVLVTSSKTIDDSVINSPDSVHNVVANVKPDKDGIFRFEHLTNGTYGLALLVEDNFVSFEEGFTVNGVTGLISVTKKQPTINLPAIQF